jgi:hypothetical protein
MHDPDGQFSALVKKRKKLSILTANPTLPLFQESDVQIKYTQK